MINRIPLAIFAIVFTAISSIVLAQGKVDPESLLSKTTHAVRVDSPPTIDLQNELGGLDRQILETYKGDKEGN